MKAVSRGEILMDTAFLLAHLIALYIALQETFHIPLRNPSRPFKKPLHVPLRNPSYTSLKYNIFQVRVYRNLLKLKKLSLPSVVREVKGQQFFLG